MPAMLLCPLAFAALVPNRASNDADRRSVAGNCSGGYANGCGFRMVVGSDALDGGAIHGRRC
ncbi:MAG: hypothetical protein INH34_12975 [Phycisphaerales bacterium]|nr:hypothetical protein [Phycisphaerales bacterium]